MRIVDDIEQQIQQSEFLTILIQAMKSIGESRMTDQYRTVIKGLLQKNLPIDIPSGQGKLFGTSQRRLNNDKMD